ncbi:NAD(P)-dependent oxidoreductase [Veronia nyctiphanis]|uniref:NAD(P)-dependent oxidoreductase n=1 Tax=Veronia nyctiphanis TaxID=1278244 RepID=A0A4Q0YX89_9GAMM|nr:SDR family oxidoreductase [Veronia nyctiphanis]RXJ74924.1 NAD(P)-dependent oxidoreductase [Veronia nyctiphanis]
MTQLLALVTGASRGIGAETALQLASKGYLVCVNYLRQREAAENVVEEIQRRGGNAFSLSADISSEKEVQQLFAKLDARPEPLDLLVNNAGILFAQSPLADMTLDRFNKVMTVNVAGTFLCCREAIKRMSTKNGGQGGVIINVSSGASRTGSPNEYIDYAASKGAVDTLTVGLAKEAASLGIRVNAVRPGLIYTDIHADGGEPGRVSRLASNIPLQRGGTVEEVASAIVYLSSKEASFITGSFLDVSGGL